MHMNEALVVRGGTDIQLINHDVDIQVDRVKMGAESPSSFSKLPSVERYLDVVRMRVSDTSGPKEPWFFYGRR